MVEDYSKQINLIDVNEFKTPINIIGCGATGSWLAFFLVKMGFNNITIYDFDEIEEHNLPNQLFREKDIGSKKVDAFTYIYNETVENDTRRIKAVDMKVDASIASALRGIVICAVDDMDARKEIYTNAFKYGQADMWIESRLGLYGSYIYTLTRNSSEEHIDEYESSFYGNEEAEVSHCGVSQTGLPAAVNCASIIIMNMIEEKPYFKIEYSIPNMINFVEA